MPAARGTRIHNGTRADKAFHQDILHPLMDVLDIGEEDRVHLFVGSGRTPVEAQPGDYVLDIDHLAEVDPATAESIRKLAELELLCLQVAVPNRWDVALKPYWDLKPEDYKAIDEAKQKEQEWLRREIEVQDNMLAVHYEHATDEDAVPEEVLDWLDENWRPKRPRPEDWRDGRWRPK